MEVWTHIYGSMSAWMYKHINVWAYAQVPPLSAMIPQFPVAVVVEPPGFKHSETSYSPSAVNVVFGGNCISTTTRKASCLTSSWLCRLQASSISLSMSVYKQPATPLDEPWAGHAAEAHDWSSTAEHQWSCTMEPRSLRNPIPVILGGLCRKTLLMNGRSIRIEYVVPFDFIVEESEVMHGIGRAGVKKRYGT